MIYKNFIKRPMDLILSLIALIVLSPALLATALLVRFKIGSPVLFKQNRPGLNEKIFTLYKFRTMTDERDQNGELLPDSVRLTRFGKFLRSTSLDELPELWNIIRGDMSIIGPRPLLVQYLPLYNEYQRRRHQVRPGLSGLAQVSGRNAISWENKFSLDVEYVENMSFIGDWKIIFFTIKKVFFREGINSDISVTMEPFQGTTKNEWSHERKSKAMKNKLLIIGASGHGKVVADIALQMNRWQSIAFLDDDETIKQSMGMEIIGKSIDAINYINDYDIFVAIGNNETREKIQERLNTAEASFPILIHPNAVIGALVHFGEGTVVMAGVVINCCTKIGKGCIINTGATIDHDNKIEDYVHISPGTNLAGTVKIGKGTWLGIGSVVINNVNVTYGSKIGAGAVLVKDITEPGTYVGVPARRI